MRKNVTFDKMRRRRRSAMRRRMRSRLQGGGLERLEELRERRGRTRHVTVNYSLKLASSLLT